MGIQKVIGSFFEAGINAPQTDKLKPLTSLDEIKKGSIVFFHYMPIDEGVTRFKVILVGEFSKNQTEVAVTKGHYIDGRFAPSDENSPLRYTSSYGFPCSLKMDFSVTKQQLDQRNVYSINLEK